MNKSKILGMIILTTAMLAAKQSVNSILLSGLSILAMVITILVIVKDLLVRDKS